MNYEKSSRLIWKSEKTYSRLVSVTLFVWFSPPPNISNRNKRKRIRKWIVGHRLTSTSSFRFEWSNGVWDFGWFSYWSWWKCTITVQVRWLRTWGCCSAWYRTIRNNNYSKRPVLDKIFVYGVTEFDHISFCLEQIRAMNIRSHTSTKHILPAQLS